LIDTFIASSPIIISAISAVLIVIFDLFINKSSKIIKFLSIIFALAILIPPILFYDVVYKAFNGQLILDKISWIFIILIGFINFSIIIISFYYNKKRNVKLNEYYALIFFAQIGLIAFVSSFNLLVLFLALEIFSFSSYILTGIIKDKLSSEAVFKYFYLGIISSSIGLLGIGLLYGGSGNLDLRYIFNSGEINIMMLVGILLFLVNIFFKFSLAPFHIWTPDVYEAAPTPISAYFSVAPKLAIVFLILRIMEIFPFGDIKDILWIISALTILWGNIVALRQNNLKRLMAYSAIAHSGYISMGFLLPVEMAKNYLVLYIIAYIFMNIVCFSYINYLVKDSKDDVNIENLSNMGVKNPMVSSIFSLSLISLAGIPPTVGFFAKFYLFLGLIKNGYLYITLIAILGTLISVYYYFRIIMYMYFRKEKGGEYSFDFGGKLVIMINGIIIIALSIYPAILFKLF